MSTQTATPETILQTIQYPCLFLPIHWTGQSFAGAIVSPSAPLLPLCDHSSGTSPLSLL